MKKQSILLLSLIFLLTLILLNCSKKKDDPTPGGGTTTPPVALTITSVNPGTGSEGTKVVITGTGFSATLATNKVKFGTTEAVLDSATTTRLVTKVPKGATTGKVTVEVGSKTASSGADFTVSVATTPATFSTDNTSSNITAETAKVSSTISANGGAGITQYGHVWSDTKTEPTTADAKTELGKTEGPFPLKFTSDLKSLKGNTTYNIRAYATNDKGTSYGTAVQVKTAQGGTSTLGEPQVIMQQQEILSVAATTILVGGFTLANIGTVFSQRGHVWSATKSNPTTEDSKTERGGITQSATNATFTSSLTGLTVNTTYNIRAYAISNSKTYYSQEWKVKTEEKLNVTFGFSQVTKLETKQAEVTAELTNLGGATRFTDHGFAVGLLSNRPGKTRLPLDQLPRTSLGARTTTGKFSTLLTNLETNEMYQAYPFVISEGGQVYYGSGVTFQALPLVQYTPGASLTTLGFLPNGSQRAMTYHEPSKTFYAGGLRIVKNQDNGADTKWVTLAGGTTAGTADGTGTAAQFTNITDMALDAQGNLIVADQVGTGSILFCLLRKVTPEGVVTTLAGRIGTAQILDGKGNQASLVQIRDMDIDGQGTIWIIDNNTIRKVTPDGTVTTIAGNRSSVKDTYDQFSDGAVTSARLYFPQGIAESNGTVYFTDASHIRKIVNGAVSTMAGQKLVTTGGSRYYVDGPAPNQDLSRPGELSIDASGRFIIGDAYSGAGPGGTGSGSVRLLTPAGVLTTLAGSPEANKRTGNGDGTGAGTNILSVRETCLVGKTLYFIDSSSQLRKIIIP